MTDRNELLEATFDSLPEGVALVGPEGEVVLWNQAAQGITGYAAIDVLARPLPEGLEPLLPDEARNGDETPGPAAGNGRRALVRAKHKLGHGIPVIARALVLRDGLGERIGAAALFHPAESLDALPHGESSEDAGADEAREEFEDRLQAEFDDFTRGGPPFSVLWIGVDQAEPLRKTHGASACHAMLDKVRHALVQGLRPAEEMSRWGDDEFLIVAHERSAEMLASHAQTLAGLARTADFRWWGDRVSLTVSVGAAQAGSDRAETLAQLMGRAREAMETSSRTGGNRATVAADDAAAAPVEGSTCLPS
ncbi:MAG: diguanylate cyclase [Terracidiphilus sp.]|jgi:diguanylate cyclase (GGDEF)-like protein/PAS domain S-box-containing protein